MHSSFAKVNNAAVLHVSCMFYHVMELHTAHLEQNSRSCSCRVIFHCVIHKVHS